MLKIIAKSLLYSYLQGYFKQGLELMVFVAWTERSRSDLKARHRRNQSKEVKRSWLEIMKEISAGLAGGRINEII